jgi:hypothetical protein
MIFDWRAHAHVHVHVHGRLKKKKDAFEGRLLLLFWRRTEARDRDSGANVVATAPSTGE